MLKEWTPKALKELYEKVQGVDDQSTQALHRLSTDEGMESVWATLLSKPIAGWNDVKTNKADLEQALAITLWGSIQKTFNNPNGERPGDKNKSLKKIKTQIDKLMELLDGEESKHLINTYLHAQNYDYRQGNNQDRIALTQAPFNAVSDAENINKEESIKWADKTVNARLAWWTKEATETSLESLLSFYKGRLDHVGNSYSEGYWSAQKAETIRDIKKMMTDFYGEPLLDKAAIICSSILGEFLDKTDLSQR